MQILTDKQILEVFKEKRIDPDTLGTSLVKQLTRKRLKIASAESCTGGLFSKRITDVSGSSKVFDCGICSYSNEIKHKILGVERETLETRGAVSAATAVRMAKGVKKLARADIGVGITGIAGPDGGTPDKPVGLVYLGIATESGSHAIKLLLGGEGRRLNSRSYIRELAVDTTLYTVLNMI